MGLYVGTRIRGCTSKYMTVHGHHFTQFYTNLTPWPWKLTACRELPSACPEVTCADYGMPPGFFLFLSVLCILRILRIFRTYILEDRRVDHESVSSGKAPAMQVSAYAACRTPVLHAIGAL